MERSELALKDDTLTPRIPDHDLRPVVPAAVRINRKHQLAAQPVEIECNDLAEARRIAISEHDIAADLQLQVVEGDLEGEPAPVHRGRERKYRRFEFSSRFTKARQLSGKLGVHAHGGTVPSSGT